MIQLFILGPAEIRNEKGELEHSFLAGPKRLALLTYLLLSRPRGFHRRDSLLPIFWQDQNQKSARNALSNMLFHIRQTLGKDSIENRGTEEITLNPEVFWCDTLAFEEAIEKNNYQKAISLYRGDLLKGFHVDASAEFVHWLEQERKKFHSLVVDANRKLAKTAYNEQDLHLAISRIRNAVQLDPFSESLHSLLITFLDQMGDPHAAIGAYNSFAHLLQEEFEVEPGAELKNLIAAIKKRETSPQNLSSKKIFTEKQSQPSIAVLPFETLGMEKASAFTDAIHGDILTRLSQVSDLFVISRTSVQSFRGSRKLLPQIARELQVEWILTGEVQEIERQVKVSVRLVNPFRDRQVWAEIYQRELTAHEIFNIQAEITHQITEALEMRLTNKEQKAIQRVPTKDLEAFRLHAHGRWSLDQRTEKGMRIAEGYFRNAIERDPNYAQAWLGLADSLALLHDYGHEKDNKKILLEAERAALEALKTDPNLAEAYASLGLLYTTKRNGKAAVSNLRKAIELRPGYAEAHAWLCWILQLIGNRSEGLESAEKGVVLNPLSQEAVSNLSLACLTNRDYSSSLHEANRLLQLQPDFTSAKLLKGLALYHLEKYEEAGKILKDLEVPWAGNGPLVTRILTLLKRGRNHKAQKLSEGIPEDKFATGLIHAAKGEQEMAFLSFKSILQWNYWEMLSIHHLYPDILDPIRGNERFLKILQKVNKSWGFNDSPQKKIGQEKFTLTGGKIPSIINGIDNFSEKSIAVLPFKDLDSEEPRFGDGIHGDILVSLSRIKHLHVISRISVFNCNRIGKSAAEVGVELKC